MYILFSIIAGAFGYFVIAAIFYYFLLKDLCTKVDKEYQKGVFWDIEKDRLLSMAVIWPFLCIIIFILRMFALIEKLVQK